MMVRLKMLIIISCCAALCSCGGSAATAVEASLVDRDFDGVWDVEDQFPNDTDNDGETNDVDDDDDNDGVLDENDAFPYNPLESLDTDADGVGDAADTDDDGDGILDAYDHFPRDPAEIVDTDLDGLGNNADPDNDADGFADANDLFPNDATRAGDHDDDGVDSLHDLDDDNDGYLDAVEIAEAVDPLSALSTPQDADHDGLSDVQEVTLGCDPTQSDSDGDTLRDDLEIALGTSCLHADTDSDGVRDNIEMDGWEIVLPDFDGDGIIDALDFNTVVTYTLPPSTTNIVSRSGITTHNEQLALADFQSDTVAHGPLSSLWSDFDALSQVSAGTPSDLAYDSQGNLYIAEQHLNRIRRVSALAEADVIYEAPPDGSPGSFLAPQGLAIDPDDNVYVADTWNNRVQRLDAKNGTWTAWGNLGSGTGELHNPRDLAVNASSHVAVADYDNYRVQVFDTEQNVVATLSSETLGETAFQLQAISLSYGPDHLLYVLDALQQRIIIFDAGYAFVRSINLADAWFGELTAPSAIHVNSTGSILISAHGKVVVF